MGAWGRTLQSTVALSNVEAEYMAICAAAQEVLFLHQLLTRLNIKPAEPTMMFADNNGCIALATNTMTTWKTKHIDTSYHFIKQFVNIHAVEVQYYPTKDMVLDALTTFSLSIALHLGHVGTMLSGTYEPPPIWEWGSVRHHMSPKGTWVPYLHHLRKARRNSKREHSNGAAPIPDSSSSLL